MVVFVKRTVRRRGDKSYEYLSLVEAVREDGRNTHRTLLRLGEVSELRSSGQIDRIIRALRAYAEGTWLEVAELSGNGAPSFGATAAVWSYFRRLGVDEYFSSLGDGRRSKVVSDTVFAMVANRLIDPASKRRTITEWLSSVALCALGHAEIQAAAPARRPGTAMAACCRRQGQGPLCPLAAGTGAVRLDDGSRMSREAHVRFCESRGVRFPPATHLVVLASKIRPAS